MLRQWVELQTTNPSNSTLIYPPWALTWILMLVEISWQMKIKRYLWFACNLFTLLLGFNACRVCTLNKIWRFLSRFTLLELFTVDLEHVLPFWFWFCWIVTIIHPCNEPSPTHWEYFAFNVRLVTILYSLFWFYLTKVMLCYDFSFKWISVNWFYTPFVCKIDMFYNCFPV